MDKLCAHEFWGYTPALDLLSHAPASTSGRSVLVESGSAPEVSLLQYCCGDARHLLRTLLSHLDGGPKVAYRVHEKDIELLARHFLLLRILLDASRDCKERCETFVEIYGNVCLTEKGEDELCAYAAELEDWITSLNPSRFDSILAALDVSSLKYQEKDELLRVFRSWRKANKVNSIKLWEYRSRKLYGDRYDFRKNLIDWDYHMTLRTEEDAGATVEEGTSIIHFYHFRTWRLSGMAYAFRDRRYNVPNRTLLSTISSRLEQFKDRNLNAKGTGVTAYGYWGDAQNAPYLGMGTRCFDPAESARLFKKTNKQHEHTAVTVAMANLELLVRRFDARVAALAGGRPTCGVSFDVRREEGEGDGEEGWEYVAVTMDVSEPHRAALRALEGFSMHFTTGDPFRKVKRGPGIGACDVVCLGCKHAGDMPGWLGAVDAKAVVLVEDVANLVELTKEHKEAFSTKLKEMAAAQAWHPIESVEGRKQHCLHFEKLDE